MAETEPIGSETGTGNRPSPSVPQNGGRASIEGRRRADAEILLDFAIEQGLRIEDAEVAAIRRRDGVEFEHAYARLAKRMRPVTAATLRATESDESLSWWQRLVLGSSEAESWSRVLWAITIFMILLTVGAAGFRFASGAGVNIESGADSEFFADEGRVLSLADFCMPFLFGALGACAYLLRTCHWFTHRRTFDPRREPEYINRILLGLVSGGAGGLLFASYVVTAGEVGEDLSAAAIGFLCGYNNDFLFTAIERLAAAILPKVQPPPPPPTPRPSPPVDEVLVDADADERDGKRPGQSQPDRS